MLDINENQRQNDALYLAQLINFHQKFRKNNYQVHKLYHEFLNIIIELGKNFELTSSLEYCYLFRFLLYQEYLPFNPLQLHNPKSYLVYEAMKDRGNYIHYTAMLNDLITKLGGNSISIPNVTLKNDITNKLALLNYKQKPNNSFSLILENGKCYLFDLSHLKIVNRYTKNLYISMDNYYISKIILNGCEKEVIRSIKDVSLLYDFVNDDVEYIDIINTDKLFKDLYCFLNGKTDILNDFSHECSQKVEDIKRQLKKKQV